MAKRSKAAVAEQGARVGAAGSAGGWAGASRRSSRGLAVREWLPPERIAAVLERVGLEYRERIYSPVVTIWAWLTQAWRGTQGTCQVAVAAVQADQTERGVAACSSDTSSYCAARQRLPAEACSILTREIGREVQDRGDAAWLWQGREVVIVDGSTATAEDTPANQAEYPQPSGQRAGLGMPMLRLVVLLSWSVGTVLECVLGPCCGKRTGEQSLFRPLFDALKPGTILLGDRLYDCYADIAALRARGVDVVFGMKQSRDRDFRRGRRLGRRDHVVVWTRPKYDAARYGGREEWSALPETMTMRETEIVVRRRGCRPRTVTVVSTLLDAAEHSSADLLELFAQRWHCELDLRSIKQTLGMNHLRCRTPDVVRKDVWIHLLAYNLIRQRLAEAA